VADDAKPAPDKSVREADTNERTTAVGLYHYALSYRCAADALGTIKFRTTHADAPQEFLYFHAIELFLKSYLRNAGLSVLTLKGLSHSTNNLEAAFVKHGGRLADHDREVLEVMEKTDAITRSRYIVTGAFTKIPIQALARTAKSLTATVRESLKRSGHRVR
jgi:hypothetical protein